ncbi:HET-domain-containing protein [Zopfia rhizophila CBS 207.26]|uniref:HET-domain-containing protein n=1 Tax=Zopfia rhizophila CBS 207.26 TaxID=1314779 RepID=A0A6A6EV97_9PEZI|nr:HET-domain-containing protein [Zopfia rhizophila CBS 207.26]
MSLEVVQKWVSDCVLNHDGCRKGCTDTSYVPSRLIDPREPNENCRRIRITERRASQRAKYISLSYRWGDVEPLNLTSATFQHFRSGPPIYELPRTFRDVTQIAGLLEIRYIWINSLCIQQDSLQDWKRESILMRNLYVNSYCAVVAAC